MAKNKPAGIQILSARSEDQPASRGMLSLVRDELKGEIQSLDRKMEARFQGVDARFHAFDAKLHELGAAFESRFQKLEAGNTRMLIRLEEQNANNRVVLEGLQALWQRQDRLAPRR